MVNEEQREALGQIKAVYEDGVATINERDYEFTQMTFQERRSVFAYLSKVTHLLNSQNFSFIDDEEFKKIETTIYKRVKFEGDSLSKLKNHFETYTEDYIIFIGTALGVISYPFLKGGTGK